MKTYILVYNNFAHFEVVLASLFMKSKGDIITVGVNDEVVISEEGFKIIPHVTLDDVKVDDVDLFLIPGGNPEPLLGNEKLSSLLVELNNKKKIISAICAGPLHLANAGILKNKNYTTSMPVDEYTQFNKKLYKNNNVVVDGNIVTARGCGYVDFALKLGEVMNIYDNDEDYKETVNYFKNFIG